MGNEKEKRIEEIKRIFVLSKEKIETHIHELKVISSDEVLNGSIEEAQKILNNIIPIENAAKKMIRFQEEFVKIIESADIKKNNNSTKLQKEPQLAKDVKVADSSGTSTFNSSENFTAQIEFRVPILKALIYLGGSANAQEVLEFIGKDMSEKFKKGDFVIQNGNGKKRWEITVEKERGVMEAQGLLNEHSSNGTWEIVQKGIDYLSNHAK